MFSLLLLPLFTYQVIHLNIYSLYMFMHMHAVERVSGQAVDGLLPSPCTALQSLHSLGLQWILFQSVRHVVSHPHTYIQHEQADTIYIIYFLTLCAGYGDRPTFLGSILFYSTKAQICDPRATIQYIYMYRKFLLLDHQIYGQS